MTGNDFLRFEFMSMVDIYLVKSPHIQSLTALNIFDQARFVDPDCLDTTNLMEKVVEFCDYYREQLAAKKARTAFEKPRPLWIKFIYET